MPFVVMIVTFASYTLWLGNPLDGISVLRLAMHITYLTLMRLASTVFASIGVFDLFRAQLQMLFRHIPLTIQGALKQCSIFGVAKQVPLQLKYRWIERMSSFMK